MIGGCGRIPTRAQQPKITVGFHRVIIGSVGGWVAVSVFDVFGRLLEFPPDAGVPVNLLEQAPPSDGFRFVSLLPPGPKRDAALAAEMENLKGMASKLDELADELRALVVRHDPVQLIPSIAVPAAMSLGVPTSGDDATQTFSVPAKIEYLVGLSLTGPPGTAAVPMEVTRKAAGILASVFSAADAHLRLQMVSERSNGHPGIDQTSALLRLGAPFRPHGRIRHSLSKRSADAVFEPHRDLYCRELGFCPSDAIRLVRRHVAWNNTEFNTAGQEISEMMNSEEVDEEKATDSFWRRYVSMEAIYRWTPEILAQRTGLPVQQIGAMLHQHVSRFRMPARLPCAPFDDNLARRYPLVRLPEGEYLAPDPWSLAHGVHEWLQGYVQARPTSRLASRYPKHRSNAAERLVRTSLQAVFGEKTVFSNQHYVGNDGPGEIDSLVAGFTPMIVEVKSRGLTEQGRRGYRRRVQSVARDVVGKSFQQTHRARNYIIEEGGRRFANRQGGPMVRRLEDEVTDPVEIVVTLERMDPLATAAGKLAGTDQSRNVWVTNLADFLMVRDILSDPVSFLHYAQTRGRTSELGIHIYTESDALGRYLDDRLTPLIARAMETEDENWETLLGYSGTEINQFFTMAAHGTNPEKPGTGVPQVLMDALRNTALDDPRSWDVIATAVMATPPEKWRAWRRFVRRHKGEHPFLLPCGTASLVTSPSIVAPELRNGSTPVLAVPRREARTRGQR